MEIYYVHQNEFSKKCKNCHCAFHQPTPRKSNGKVWFTGWFSFFGWVVVRVVSSKCWRECHNAFTVSVLCVEAHGVRSGYGRGSCGSQSHATCREGSSHPKGPEMNILGRDGHSRHKNKLSRIMSVFCLNTFFQIHVHVWKVYIHIYI